MSDRTPLPGAFELRLFFRENPLEKLDTARPVLELLARERGALTAPEMRDARRRYVPATPAALQGLFEGRRAPDSLTLTDGGDLRVQWAAFGPGTQPASSLEVGFPATRLAEAGTAHNIVSLARDACTLCPPLYGWAHAALDVGLGSDPNDSDPLAPKQVYEGYWLLVLGAEMVRQLTHERVAATPASSVEFLPDGSALIVTAPDPLQLLSRPAREAQARALVHLRPDLDYDQVLHGLMERSASLEPVQQRWNPDLDEVFRILLQATAIEERGSTTRRLNELGLQPPTEWRPASDALPTDVEDAASTLQAYRNQAETFVAGFHDKIPDLAKESAQSLAWIDARLYLADYQQDNDTATLERLFVPTLGAYLGIVIERRLNGRWIPRKNLDESQVVVGDRAWLPFLRVRHFVQSRQAMLERSLTQLYREAERHTDSPRA